MFSVSFDGEAGGNGRVGVVGLGDGVGSVGVYHPKRGNSLHISSHFTTIITVPPVTTPRSAFQQSSSSKTNICFNGKGIVSS